MGMTIEVIALIVALVGVFGGLVLLARRARRCDRVGGALAGAMAAYDQAGHATAYEAHLEQATQGDRVDSVETSGPRGPGDEAGPRRVTRPR